MNRISSAGQTGSALVNLLAAQNRQATAQAQVSSQTRANDLKGYGRETETLTAIRSARVRSEAYAATSQTTADRLSVQDLALTKASDAAVDARAAVAEAIANGRADSLMESLQAQFQSAASALNTQHQGRYLFAGAALDSQPVTATDLTALAAAPSTASVFTNDQRRATAKVDDATTLQTGFLADEVGGPLFDVFRRIQQFAAGPGGPLTGTLTPAQQTYLNSELANFDSAHDGLVNVVARNGGLQAQAEAAATAQQAQADHLDALGQGKTGVDMAEAITRLQQAQTAVQASAQVLATLRSTSLLDLLR